jgi:hypothetical protein
MLPSLLRRRDARDTHQMLERFILAVRSDFGCLCIVVGFLIIMIASIAFADVITPPAATPFT